MGNSPVFLEGFSLGGYRSFGERQRIGPLGKVNLFIGQNNSGKSNVLRFLTNHFRPILHQLPHSGEKMNFLDLDRPRTFSKEGFYFGIATKRDGEWIQS